MSHHIQKEKRRGREEIRIVKVYSNLEGISLQDWKGLQSLVKVYRKVVYKGKTTIETAFFISSLSPKTSAQVFQEGIRSHWNIESFHWIKDVIFKEDSSHVISKNAPQNYSLIRNIVVNILRNNGLHKIQAAIEKCANNVPFMLSLF